MKKIVSVNENPTEIPEKNLCTNHLLHLGLGISTTLFFTSIFLYKLSDNNSLKTSSKAVIISSLFSILFFLSRLSCVSEKKWNERNIKHSKIKLNKSFIPD